MTPRGRGRMLSGMGRHPVIEKPCGEKILIKPATAFLWSRCDGGKTLSEIAGDVGFFIWLTECRECVIHTVEKTLNQLEGEDLVELGSLEK